MKTNEIETGCTPWRIEYPSTDAGVMVVDANGEMIAYFVPRKAAIAEFIVKTCNLCGHLTHKIDREVDGERENIAQSLDKSGKVKSMTYYLPPDPVQDAKNASGGGYHSDGRLLVVFLQ